MKTITLTLALLTLTACGKDAPNKGSQTQSSGSLAQGGSATPKCVNPVPVDQAPADWKKIEPREVVTGGPGKWELVDVQLHGTIEAEGEVHSLSTRTMIFDRNVGENGIVQTITCKDVSETGRFSLSTQPHDTILAADGTFKGRRNIKFVVRAGSAEESASVENASGQFVQSEEAEKAILEKLAQIGGKAATQFYRVNENEFELRISTSMPDQKGGAGRINMNYAMRYRLHR